MSIGYHTKALRRSLKVQHLLEANAPSLSSWSGRLLPSGKLKIGYVPPKKISASDREYERTREKSTFFLREHWHFEKGLVREYCRRVDEPPKLGLASVQNYHKPRARKHGLRGISKGGRDRVREGAYLLERRFGRKLGFYTLTCPYTDAQSIYSYNKNIAYIQRSYFQEIKRAYARNGCAFSYVSVLEIQEERFQRSGEPVLHIHYIANCYLPNSYTFVLSADTYRDIWGRVLANCLGGGVSVSASVDASVVRSSAVGYISKYMGKGGAGVEFLGQVDDSQIPSRWWSMSRQVKRCIRETTVPLGSAICSYFMHGNGCTPASLFRLRYHRFIDICVGGKDVCVGLSADMIQSDADILRPPGLFAILYELL